MNENYNDCHQQKTICMFLVLQRVKNCETFFIYKKRDTLQKARQFLLLFNIQKAWHFTLHNFSWNFWRLHLYTKSTTPGVTWRFIYKNPDLSKKAKQFALHFYIQKTVHFALRDFSLNFCNLWKGGRHLYMRKKSHFALEMYMQKQGIKSSDWTSAIILYQLTCKVGSSLTICFCQPNINGKGKVVCVMLKIAGFKSQFKSRSFLCSKTLPLVKGWDVGCF